MRSGRWFGGTRRAVAWGAVSVLALGAGVASAATIGGAQDPAAVGAYWEASPSGVVTAFGGAPGYGGIPSTLTLAKPVTAIAPTPDGKGYWMVGADGGVFNFGDAHFYGSLGSETVPAPIAGITADPDGLGYRLYGETGLAYSFRAPATTTGTTGTGTTGTGTTGPTTGTTGTTTTTTPTGPTSTTVPGSTVRHGLRIRLTIDWTWDGAVTRVSGLRVGHFPGARS